MKKRLLIAVMCLVAPLTAQKKESIRRFDDSDLPIVKTKTKFTTLIILPEGEEIAEVTCGDKDFWIVEGKDNVVHVKPAKEGAITNINIISTNKTIYSFLVQEVTKGGRLTEKPDLRIELGSEELPKLRRDKAELEEALSRSERRVKDLEDKRVRDEKREEDAKKKDYDTPPGVTNPTKPDRVPNTPEVEQSLPAASMQQSPGKSEAPRSSPNESIAGEEPIIRAYAIERRESLVQKGGRAVGRFFKRIGRVLGIVKNGND